jgi:hypothetical protein
MIHPYDYIVEPVRQARRIAALILVAAATIAFIL